MNELIIFVWVVLFSASAPTGAGFASDSSVADPDGRLWTQETCDAHESLIWGQTAEDYAESDVLFMFSECQRVVMRPVRQIK